MLPLHRNIKILPRLFLPNRAYSTPQKTIQKSVYISQSKDIFTNLALEDWLYKNRDFTNHNILMLWQNNPCVVIGRHQNPWLEANVSQLKDITEHGVQLARRNSGGGTVYHDEGNLNMTFFTTKEQYNRRHNLEIVTRALFKEYGVRLEISSREDLVLKDCKISGTAAKLGRPNAYHHCTLLVNSNKANLRKALKKLDADIETNATKSIKSKIINFCEEGPEIDVSSLYTVVGLEYLSAGSLPVDAAKFMIVSATEQCFPGIEEIRDNLQSWKWRFGKTPKFTITRSFAVPDNLLGNAEVSDETKVTVVVEGGKIVDARLLVPPRLVGRGFICNIDGLIGRRFSEEALNSLEWSLGSLGDKGIRQEVH